MKTSDEKLKLLENIALEIDAELPLRVWVEGDGKMYGDFQSAVGRRISISPFEAVRLVHIAATAARRMISV